MTASIRIIDLVTTDEDKKYVQRMRRSATPLAGVAFEATVPPSGSKREVLPPTEVGSGTFASQFDGILSDERMARYQCDPPALDIFAAISMLNPVPIT